MRKGSKNDLPGHNERESSDRWFSDAQIVDSQWVEFTVVTASGERVRYRIPRRTLFDSTDQ
jgi:hypothetical protein